MPFFHGKRNIFFNFQFALNESGNKLRAFYFYKYEKADYYFHKCYWEYQLKQVFCLYTAKNALSFLAKYNNPRVLYYKNVHRHRKNATTLAI